MPKYLDNKNIVFFDGECGLCNSVVDVLIRADKHHRLHFSSLQSPFAEQLLSKMDVSIKMDTIYFYHQKKIYSRSTAVKQILFVLGGPWHFLGKILSALPNLIGDYIYNRIAKNRFRLFGKTSCRVPSPKERKRFLD